MVRKEGTTINKTQRNMIGTFWSPKHMSNDEMQIDESSATDASRSEGVKDDEQEDKARPVIMQLAFKQQRTTSVNTES
ncbi:hypothetical protein V6N13_058463 [Hibiscus sabdariffa]